MNENVKIFAQYSVRRMNEILQKSKISHAFSPTLKIAYNASFDCRERRDREKKRAIQPPLHSESPCGIVTTAAPRRVAAPPSPCVHAVVCTRNVSPHASRGTYFPFDFPRSFRAANRAAPLLTTRRSEPVPRVSVSLPVSLYFPPRGPTVRVWHGVRWHAHTRARRPIFANVSLFLACARAHTLADTRLRTDDAHATAMSWTSSLSSVDPDGRRRWKNRGDPPTRRVGRAIHKWLRRDVRACARPRRSMGACVNERRNVCDHDDGGGGDEETSRRDASRAATFPRGSVASSNHRAASRTFLRVGNYRDIGETFV